MIAGPAPTSCWVENGCIQMTFWGRGATELRETLATEHYDAFLYCDDAIRGSQRYDPTFGANTVDCRDPETGLVKNR